MLRIVQCHPVLSEHKSLLSAMGAFQVTSEKFTVREFLFCKLITKKKAYLLFELKVNNSVPIQHKPSSSHGVVLLWVCPSSRTRVWKVFKHFFIPYAKRIKGGLFLWSFSLDIIVLP